MAPITATEKRSHTTEPKYNRIIEKNRRGGKKKMNQMQLAYLILGIFSCFTLFIVVLVIAGKAIIYAFFRRFTQKFNDVFIVNPNKQLSHYYKKSKDGVFNIDGKMYITNPDKLLSMSDKMVKEVQEKISIGLKLLKLNIKRKEQKKEIVLKKIKALKNVPNSIPIIEKFELQVTELENRIELLKSRLTTRINNYWFNKRGAYFYIEGDPVPKDFFSFYTEMDSVQLENVIMRAQTKDPKNLQGLEKSILWIKRFIMFALIAGGVAAFFALKNNSMLQDIGKNLGIVFSGM